MTPKQWRYITYLRNRTEPVDSKWKSTNPETRKKAKEESYEALKNASSEEIQHYIEVLQDKMKKLFPGWNPYSKNKYKPTVCIDLDGVIADYSKGWQGDEYFGEPITNPDHPDWNPRNGLRKLKDKGLKIDILTARKKKDLVRDYLNKHKIPFDSISIKPSAKAYVDDRGVCFYGDWSDEFIDKILKFKRWQER